MAIESTRIEIFRDGLWRELRLRQIGAVRYNAVINKIGKTDTREISHTNTFSLPYVDQNIKALDLNIFNASKLAKALNTKYVARYYVREKLLQTGYLVINNTVDGVINVNFIDEGLDITDTWGTTTFRELLESDNPNIPADYQAAITEMTDYDLDKTAVLTPLTNVGARGYNLALFPNNLNAIGDLFQKDDDGLRVNQYFNPYQSRPIFNVKALFDLACETYGYTPIYDPSVDWSKVEALFMVEKGLNDNLFDEGGLSSIDQPVNQVSFYYYQTGVFGSPQDWATTVNHATTIDALRPNDIPNWANPPNFIDSSNSNVIPGGYLNQRCVYVPRISQSILGDIEIQWGIVVPGNPSGGFIQKDHYIAWEGTGPSPSVKFTTLTFSSIITDTSSYFHATIDKDVFDPANAPANSNGKAIGIIQQIRNNGVTNAFDLLAQNTTVSETYVPSGVIAYDEFGQYISNSATLTYAAPDETIKKLMAQCMAQQGILMNIDGKAKEITFFSYGKYETRRLADESVDWTDYLLKFRPSEYNTDYGNDYGRLNKIGLASPYIGNTFQIELSNQGAESKYKDFAENFSSIFKDVTKITNVDNTTTPYFEYENTGLGLVEETGTLGTLTQARADGTTQGSFSGLAAVANVNYADPPEGIIEWYRLVDRAVRTQAFFLLPLLEISDLDLTKPIWIDELNGYWIIEEIEEFQDAHTPVRVKLIKLIDNLITV